MFVLMLSWPFSLAETFQLPKMSLLDIWEFLIEFQEIYLKDACTKFFQLLRVFIVLLETYDIRNIAMYMYTKILMTALDHRLNMLSF